MRINYSERYSKLTPKNQKRFREHISSKFEWNNRMSFYNLINGKSGVSLIERDYIDALFNEYFEMQVAATKNA